MSSENNVEMLATEHVGKTGSHRSKHQIRPNKMTRHDIVRAQNYIRQFFQCFGYSEDEYPDMDETPKRIVEAYQQLLFDEPWSLMWFDSQIQPIEQDLGIVCITNIPVVSLCRHHALPWTGTASIAYIPNERVVGLSKLALVVQSFARGLTVQEEVSVGVVDFIMKHLEPKGVSLQISAAHQCMTLLNGKGRANCPEGTTTTITHRGAFFTNAAARQELMHLFGKGHY